MRSFIVAALAAIIAASPIQDILPRAVCPTTSGGLTGPFYIQVTGENSKTEPDYNLDYAGTIPNKGLPFLVLNYKSTASKNVQEFYLNSAGQLITNPTGTTNYAYLYPPPYTNYVSLSTSEAGANITCTINSISCALQCRTPTGQSTSCLASPKFDPEWRLGGPSVVKPGCPSFTPVAVAA